MSMAKVVLSGTLSSDPEKRFTNNTNQPVTNFSLTVPVPPGPSGQSNGKTFMVRVTCWRALAEAAEAMQKGQSVLIEGKLQTNSYQGQDGVQKKTFEIEAQTIAQLSELPRLLSTPQATPQGQPATAPASGGNAYASPPNPAMAVAAAPQTMPSAIPAAPLDGFTTEDDIPF